MIKITKIELEVPELGLSGYAETQREMPYGFQVVKTHINSDGKLDLYYLGNETNVMYPEKFAVVESDMDLSQYFARKPWGFRETVFLGDRALHVWVHMPKLEMEQAEAKVQAQNQSRQLIQQLNKESGSLIQTAHSIPKL